MPAIGIPNFTYLPRCLIIPSYCAIALNRGGGRIPLTRVRYLVRHAAQHGYLVASFKVHGAVVVQAVVSAAEAARAPAIVAVDVPGCLVLLLLVFFFVFVVFVFAAANEHIAVVVVVL